MKRKFETQSEIVPRPGNPVKLTASDHAATYAAYMYHPSNIE